MTAGEHPPKSAGERHEPAGKPNTDELRSVNPKARRDKSTDARQSGFVTAELAAVLPVVVAVLALSVWAVATAGMKVRAIDAANTAALAAARGEDAQAVAAPYLPDGSSVSITHDGDLVRATVTAPSRPLGVLTPAVEISAQAAALREPGLPE
ncbi:TadE family type IV pilus minor pilin [Glycomyces arizonensis]|uniref:TadE family type IV pilus minor pilin n=1 Tax=Glycomyces arizonensis TaxID=256035 RepID=UPI00040DC439|nr:TadE family type IV pilus minor pilin [Glycomyces arizonensis]